MKSVLILSGNLVQDHEFIYPYYRLLEDKLIQSLVWDKKLLSYVQDFWILYPELMFHDIQHLLSVHPHKYPK